MSYTERQQRGEAGFTEFVILMASLTATAAMSIDMILPSLGMMHQDFNLTSQNSSQLVIVWFFIGFSIGQLIHGPVSDATGRKNVVYAGSVISLCGSLMCLMSTSFTMMLVGRFLQGVGIASARTMVNAIIRDKFDGDKMAQVTSIIMAVFIIVPVLAPAGGQLIISLYNWRYIFVLFIVVTLINLCWFALRQSETLMPQNRSILSLSSVARALTEFCSNRFSMGYTIICGLTFGSFFGYLNSARQIFQDMYKLDGNQFVFYFAVLASVIGISSLINAKLVVTIGARTITFLALAVSTTAALPFLAILLYQDLVLSFTLYMLFCAISFAGIGMTFGNLTALSLEPMKHIAGTASAINGGLSGLIAISFGALVGQLYDDNLLPLIGGFIVSGIAGILCMFLIEKRLIPLGLSKKIV